MNRIAYSKHGARLGAGLLTLMFALLFAGPAAAKETIKVGEVVAWPSYSMMQLAVEQNLVPSKYDVQVQVLQDPLTAYGLLASGKLDVLGGTADYVSVAVAKGLPIVGVSMNDLSYGTDQVVAAPGVRGAPDVKGQKIAAPQAYIGELLMGLWLDKIGVKPAEVDWVDINAPNAVGPMLSGKLAAAYMYNPWIDKVLKNMDGAHVVATSHQPYYLKTGILGDTIYMNKDFVKNHRQAAKDMIKARFDGLQYWHEHTNQANEQIAQFLQWPKKDVEAVVGTNGKYRDGGLYLFDFDQAAKYCGVKNGELPLGLKNGQWKEAATKTNQWWIKLGLLEHMHEVSSGIDCSLVQELVDSGYHQSMSARQ